MNNTQTKARCKVGDVTYKSAVTIDWTGCTVEDVQALASQKLVNKVQTEQREAGKPIPETYTIKAAEYKQGLRKPALSGEQILAAMSEEELIALMKARGLM